MIKTKPSEFKKFHKILMSNAPEGYIPWYFPVVKNNKAPDGLAVAKRASRDCKEKKGNWKASWARLSYEEAVERLRQGDNVGISGRKEDPLIIIDIDNWDYRNMMPDTLTIRSRKRCGFHGYCWKDSTCNKLPLNIPTEFGEIRSSDQYVVAPGSYCVTNRTDIEEENIPDEIKKILKEDKRLGLYTIEKEKQMITISFDGLPVFFKEQYNKEKEKPEMKSEMIKPTGKHSALFDLTMENIISIALNKREPHPLHKSDTGMNFSIANGLAHCWRHLVSLNAIQFLVVKSGYMNCQDAGTGHKGSGAGSSSVINDDGAIFWAWYQAKKDNLIPLDDPIPIKAMKYIAKKHKLIDEDYDILPKEIFMKVIEIVEEKY